MPAGYPAKVARSHREVAPETEPAAIWLTEEDTRTSEAAAAASLASTMRAWLASNAGLRRPAPHNAQRGARAQHEHALCRAELLEAGACLRGVLAATRGPASGQLAPALARFGGALVRWHALTSAGVPKLGASPNPVRALLEALTSACRLGLTSTVIDAVDAVTACACFNSGEIGQLMSEVVISTWDHPATARTCLPSAAPFAGAAPGSATHGVLWPNAHSSQQAISFSTQLRLFRRCAAAGAEAARAAAAAATASVHYAAPSPVPAESAAADGPETAGSQVQEEHAAGSHGPAAAPAWLLGHVDQGIHAPVPEDAPLHSLGHPSTRPHLPTQACLCEESIGGFHNLSICPSSCAFPCRTCLPSCVF